MKKQSYDALLSVGIGEWLAYKKFLADTIIGTHKVEGAGRNYEKHYCHKNGCSIEILEEIMPNTRQINLDIYHENSKEKINQTKKIIENKLKVNFRKLETLI